MDASREVLAIDVATMIRRRLIEGSSAGIARRLSCLSTSRGSPGKPGGSPIRGADLGGLTGVLTANVATMCGEGIPTESDCGGPRPTRSQEAPGTGEALLPLVRQAGSPPLASWATWRHPDGGRRCRSTFRGGGEVGAHLATMAEIPGASSRPARGQSPGSLRLGCGACGFCGGMVNPPGMPPGRPMRSGPCRTGSGTSGPPGPPPGRAGPARAPPHRSGPG